MPKKIDKPQVLVLGSTGMLGHMVLDYLRKNPQLQVYGTARKTLKDLQLFDAIQFVQKPESRKLFKNIDYVINCIGIIKPHCHDDNQAEVETAIAVNALFPHMLSGYLAKKFPQAKIIQIATDCVYSGKEGDYAETALHDPTDVYGKTKSLGEVKAPNVLNIRCSIIGPEQGTNLSLLEWFLHQPSGATLSGYKNHFWNGVTTLQFAELCEKIIIQDKFSELWHTHYVHHFLPNEKVSKFRLLQIFQSAFKTNFKIQQTAAATGKVDRSLTSKFSNLGRFFPSASMQQAITQLAEYLYAKKI